MKRLIVFLSLAIVACIDSSTVSSPALQPGAGKDLAANEGIQLVEANPRFFFLPPLAPTATYSGASDGSAKPSVSICEVTAAGACGAVVATYQRHDDQSVNTAIQYDVSAEQYHVNWSIGSCAGTCDGASEKNYRITVLVDAAELGHVDVRRGAKSQLQNAETGEVISLGKRNTVPVKFRIEKQSAPVIPVYMLAFTNGVVTDGACCMNDIMLMKTDGSGRINLTNTPDHDEIVPRWSPDGTRIVYRRDLDFWIMNADGSGQRPMSVDNNSAWPSFSPDGTKIVFTRGYQVWIMNADGSEAHQLSFSGLAETYPVFSPDGRTIAFSRDGATRDVWIMDADGSNDRVLARGAEYANWSPDGTRLSYQGDKDIWVINADGSDPVRITNDGSNDWASWTPDGAKIVFVSHRFQTGNGQWEVMMMNPDGTGLERLTTTEFDAEHFPTVRPRVP